MTIEFYGLPGSGKTTTAAALHRRLIARGIDAELCRPGERIRNKGLGAKTVLFIKELIWRRRILASLPFREILSKNSLRDLKLLLSSFAYTSMYYEDSPSFGEKSSEVVIIDEGFFQRLFSLFAFQEADDVKRIETYLDALPPVDLRIYLKTEVDTSMQRMKQRGSLPIRMQNMEATRIKSILETGEKIFDRIEGEEIIVVENDIGDVEMIVEYITTKVDGLLESIYGDRKSTIDGKS